MQSSNYSRRLPPISARLDSSRLGGGEKDFAERKADRPRLRAQPSQIRWLNQFNLSLDPVTARDSRAVGTAREDFCGAKARRARTPGRRSSQFHDETVPQEGAKTARLFDAGATFLFHENRGRCQEVRGGSGCGRRPGHPSRAGTEGSRIRWKGGELCAQG